MPGKLLSVVLFLRLNKSFLILLKHTFPLKHLNLENFKEDCTVIWPVSPLDTKIWKNILSSWELILNSSKYHQHGIRSEIGISLITLNVFKCLTVSLFPLKFIFFGNGSISDSNLSKNSLVMFFSMFRTSSHNKFHLIFFLMEWWSAQFITKVLSLFAETYELLHLENLFQVAP